MQRRMLQCDPEYFDGKTEIEVNVPCEEPEIEVNLSRRLTNIRISAPSYSTIHVPVTIAEQVDDAIREWYAALGSPVPENEIGIGEIMAAIDRAEEKRIEEARAKAEEDTPAVIPSYGTPEFWAYHRAKKAAENKRRAEAGLPSLDEEKAQKEAAKAAKKAAKAK
jgi:hypothetical protein